MGLAPPVTFSTAKELEALETILKTVVIPKCELWKYYVLNVEVSCLFPTTTLHFEFDAACRVLSASSRNLIRLGSLADVIRYPTMQPSTSTARSKSARFLHLVSPTLHQTAAFIPF